MPYSLTDLNQMSQAEFAAALGAVFEHTPGIAAAAWHQQPFQDRSDLYAAMVSVLRALPPDKKIALLRAHPQLGSKAKMAPASVAEQSGVGLDLLSPEEFEWLRSHNEAYETKFGFPFVVAVKEHTKASIFALMAARLECDRDTELATAIAEIEKIARFRLEGAIL